jgi:hypothetical protein
MIAHHDLAGWCRKDEGEALLASTEQEGRNRGQVARRGGGRPPGGVSSITF